MFRHAVGVSHHRVVLVEAPHAIHFVVDAAGDVLNVLHVGPGRNITRLLETSRRDGQRPKKHQTLVFIVTLIRCLIYKVQILSLKYYFLYIYLLLLTMCGGGKLKRSAHKHQEITFQCLLSINYMLLVICIFIWTLDYFKGFNKFKHDWLYF